MTLLATPLPLANLEPAAASHRPQLDALRALAVIAVLLVHFWPALPSFGQEAVRLFFVLSGFLITSQLLDGRAALGAHAPASGVCASGRCSNVTPSSSCACGDLGAAV
mgnify:CR=1 FL=1